MWQRCLVLLFSLIAFQSEGRAQDAAWGTIQGRIVWPSDKPPQAAVLRPAVAGCPPAIPGEKWVVNAKNKGIRWVLVWLDPMVPANKLAINPALKAPPKLTLDQPQCAFEPHVLGMREGQVLEAKNSASLPHNVNYTGNLKINPGANLLVPAGTAIEIKDLKAQELPVTVACSIHPWMSARVGVFEHPYFAVTDADGKFKIPPAPVGNCRLKIWHEELGFLGGFPQGRLTGKVIAIKGGAATDLGDIALDGAK